MYYFTPWSNICVKVVEEADRKGWQLLPAGFAGTGPNGSFFEAPAWVDQTKAPGTTSQVGHCITVYSEEN